MSGWIAAIAGFAAFGAAAYKVVTGAPDSTVDTPWYVPQGTEDLINMEIARIQQEQKGEVEAALLKALGKGALVMTLVGVGLGAVWSGSKPPRRASR